MRFCSYLNIGTIPRYVEHSEANWRHIDAELEQKTVKYKKCETLRKYNFLEKWKNRNFGKNPKFSRSYMTKRTLPLELSREI